MLNHNYCDHVIVNTMIVYDAITMPAHGIHTWPGTHFALSGRERLFCDSSTRSLLEFLHEKSRLISNYITIFTAGHYPIFQLYSVAGFHLMFFISCLIFQTDIMYGIATTRRTTTTTTRFSCNI